MFYNPEKCMSMVEKEVVINVFALGLYTSDSLNRDADNITS